MPPENREATGAHPGRFKPGQTGNPGGRPKVDHRVVDLAREHTELAVKTLAEICGNSKAAPSSRVAAACALLDRGWGRPRQSVELSGPEGLDFSIAVNWGGPASPEADDG